ncbi:hypothetical protein BV25DRAFT_1832295 [Artomyces pyxidatus]|uniref:Uncharacterized protein n=1 Tax=Artomyces pyxidatus TaxID=48021 RepID=A0ACB8SKL8_9AGAM|nr:hypothetical protein BV25DRAFT_1832295 [Artomyces pyxidatus]
MTTLSANPTLSSQTAATSSTDVEMAAPVVDLMEPLRQAIVDKPPYISGTLPLTEGDFSLFYKSGDGSNARHIDLADATPEQLQALADACEPATFGVEQQDVMDESYRKAGKMDSQAFMTRLIPERTSLVDIVRGYLLEGADSSRTIKLELYKLNVYSKGSFFKAHVDTPRSEDMFGSLVLVFPTPHEGGALVLRHHEQEWTFDSAKAVSEAPKPSIGYVAFFSDVEHEVTLVTEGHRVTVTYNLYFTGAEPASAPVVPAVPAIPANEAAFKSAFEALLENPEFLPRGGTLGFGLRHVYPIKDSLAHVYGMLKGSDAAVFRACAQLGFEPVLYLLYCTHMKYGREKSWGMIDRVPHFAGYWQVEDPVDMIKEEGGLVLKKPYAGSDEIDERVKWVTKITKLTRHTSPYMAYGNEAELGFAYGDVCLIVRVGKPSERLAYPTVAAMKAEGKAKKQRR